MPARETTVLIVEDDQPLKEALVSTLEDAGLRVLAAGDGGEALKIVGESPVDLVVTDVQMQPVDGHELLRNLSHQHPDLPVLLMTAYGTIDQAVNAMRDGAVDYLVKPFEAHELEERVVRYLPACAPVDALVAVDPRSEALLRLARKVAASDVTVLLTGESGSGKEVIARFIHERSARCDGPFVAINCAAIPDQMLEALLFGHEKGAFTGAAQRATGKFVQANGGSLLLDEITEMDLSLQAKLLRVLQEREVEPLGAAKPISLNVRVMATTNRDLEEAVAQARFREDLYYRLNVFPLMIPPLRERRGDIVPLARHCIEASASQSKRTPRFSESAIEFLEACPWPGNVRQLENVIQRALVLHADEDTLTAEHLAQEATGAIPSASSDLSDELWAEESRRIVAALETSRGSRKLAAKSLGISPRTLRYKLSKMRAAGVDFPGSRFEGASTS